MGTVDTAMYCILSHRRGNVLYRRGHLHPDLRSRRPGPDAQLCYERGAGLLLHCSSITAYALLTCALFQSVEYKWDVLLARRPVNKGGAHGGFSGEEGWRE